MNLTEMRATITACKDFNNAIEIQKAHQELDEVNIKIKKLEHHLNATIGLYAIDFDPKGLIKKFADSQSDACRLVVEDVEDLVEDWGKWIDNKNHTESPFDQIK